MPTVNTVLWPTDYSETSRHALDHATALAKWYEARLVGIHVYAPSYAPVPAVMSPQEVELDVAASLEPARTQGVSVDARAGTGPAAQAIVDCAASLPADLIVIGTHGAGGFEHLVLGSVTEKVLRKATCPVLTVPPRALATSTLPYKHLLCAVDFSEPSIAALEFAFSLAKEGDAALTIVHVLESFEEEPHPNSVGVPEYMAYREQDAGVRLARLVPDEAREWCTAETLIRHGKAYREILDFAATGHMDLIVMGVCGRTAIEMALFGSTTNQVIRRATCPVLTIRRDMDRD